MKIVALADGLGFCEGPVALPDGSIAVSSINLGCVHFVRPNGHVDRVDTGGGANGLAADEDGVVYVAQNAGAWGGSGPAPGGVQVIRDGRAEYVVDNLAIPNDLVFGPDGRLWVTDPVHEFTFSFSGSSDAVPGQVHAVDVASGTSEVVLAEGPIFPNGLAFTADGDRMLLTATISSQVWEYDVSDAGLSDGRHWATVVDGHPDGCALTERGLWVATTSGNRLDLFAPGGTLLDAVDLGSGALPTNVCLDHDGTGLYVTASLRQQLLHITF